MVTGPKVPDPSTSVPGPHRATYVPDDLDEHQGTPSLARHDDRPFSGDDKGSRERRPTGRAGLGREGKVSGPQTVDVVAEGG